MLLNHMTKLQVSPEKTVYIGDRPEDEGAAQATECSFIWAWEFFGDERQLE